MNPWSSESKPLRWNGISCFIPPEWDAIVKGIRHLIIESHLHPLFEFRWVTASPKKRKNPTPDTILSQFEKETGNKLQPAEIPPFLQNLTRAFHVTPFSLGTANPLSGVILTCRKSSVTLLFQFYDDVFSTLTALRGFFESFTCISPETQDPWILGAMSFTVPQEYTLRNYSFALGRTQLDFRNKSSSLTFYRFSQANVSLGGSSLKTVGLSITGLPPDGLREIDETTLRLEWECSLAKKMINRLTRRESYHYAKFCYHRETDILLGLFIKSRKRMDGTMLSKLEACYGIIA